MSKKKGNKKNRGTAIRASDPFSKYKWLLPVACLMVTWFAFSGALNNEFTNWDDKNYILENPDIQGLSSENIKKAFSSYVMGNYHPWTILSYCVDYSIGKLNPKIYHLHNLILHLINTALVFFFISLLSGRTLIAFITSLLFGIHTMHVESVAWIAERKDLLYACFFLLSAIAYVQWLKEDRKKTAFYILSVFFFLLSVLSKGMAVSLSLLLFAIDYFSGRKLSIKTVLEKAPFLVLSVIFGIVAIFAQQSAEAIDLKTFSVFERVLFASYGMLAYLWKLIAPINLSCYYDYPVKQDGAYPLIYYIAPLLAAGVFALVYFSAKKSKVIPFGFLFFFISIVHVLQLLPVGGAIISDRYTYVPYIGLFFIIGYGIDKIHSGEWKVMPKSFVLPVFGVLCIGLVYLTRQRTEIWKDSITLWNDAIGKYGNVPKMYNGRGDAFNTAKQYENAIRDFDMALKLKPDYPDAYYNRGLAYYYLGKQQEAIRDYTLAIQHKPTLARAYYNRSGSYFTLQQFKPALEDAKKAQELGYPVDPEYLKVLENTLKE